MSNPASLINTRQLRYFLAVAKQGSIAAAAKAIHISQPSISVQIKGLEAELGVPLFERHPDGVVLTPEGSELLLHARGVMSAIDAAHASVRNLRHAAEGPVGVGIPGSLAGLLTAPLVERVAARYPGVQLRIVGGLSGHTRGWILDGRLDLALVFDSFEQPNMQLERLFSEQLFLVARRDAAIAAPARGKPRPLSMEQLAALPLVLPGPGYAIRAVIDRAAEASGVRLRIAAEVDATAEMIDVVAMVGYSSVLSLAAVRSSARQAEVTSRAIAPAIVRHVSLAHARHRPLSIAAREVQQVLKALIMEKLQETWWRRSIVRS